PGRRARHADESPTGGAPHAADPAQPDVRRIESRPENRAPARRPKPTVQRAPWLSADTVRASAAAIRRTGPAADRPDTAAPLSPASFVPPAPPLPPPPAPHRTPSRPPCRTRPAATARIASPPPGSRIHRAARAAGDE